MAEPLATTTEVALRRASLANLEPRTEGSSRTEITQDPRIRSLGIEHARGLG